MAGGGTGGSSAACPQEFSGRWEGSHHESTVNSWRTGPNAIKLGLSTPPDSNVTHSLSLYELVVDFHNFPTSGARTRLP